MLMIKTTYATKLRQTKRVCVCVETGSSVRMGGMTVIDVFGVLVCGLSGQLAVKRTLCVQFWLFVSVVSSFSSLLAFASWVTFCHV